MDNSGAFILGMFSVVCGAMAGAYAFGFVGTADRRVRERAAGTAAGSAKPNPVSVRFQDNAVGLGNFLVPKRMRSKIERTIVLAGRPDGWTVGRIVSLKLLGVVLGAFLGLSRISAEPSLVSWLILGIALFVGYFGPDALISSRATQRQNSIQRELPDILDQVTLSIEAGLGFEAAFARIGERRAGPLADEIVRAVQDMRLGMSRKDAYNALAERTDVEDLTRFVRAIVQAEQYGVSISTVVRNQSEEVRFERRKRAEAQALKLPVKIIFPLMFCILPVLFAVILTPAAMQFSETIGNN
jgi:tight adherence protein C